MSENAGSRSRRIEEPSPAPGPFRSLLVPIDHSPLSDRVLGRVARLPLAKDVRITLLHLASKDLPASLRRRAQTHAKATLEAETRYLAETLPRGPSVRSLVKVGVPRRRDRDLR